MKLAIHRYRTRGSAECERCDQLHPDASRDRARAHAGSTGHTVRYIVEDITTYRQEQPGTPPMVTVDTGGLL